jgi:hypothetical protein
MHQPRLSDSKRGRCKHAGRSRRRGSQHAVIRVHPESILSRERHSALQCVPIPILNSYLEDGTLLVALGGSLFSGPGYGSWERTGHNQFKARFKFFLFTSSGALRGDEGYSPFNDLDERDAVTSASTWRFPGMSHSVNPMRRARLA